jgi:hypothetical protein
VDGTSLESDRSVYQRMLEVTRLAQTANATYRGVPANTIHDVHRHSGQAGKGAIRNLFSFERLLKWILVCTRITIESVGHHAS